MTLGERVWYHRKALLSLVGLVCALGVWASQHLPVAIFPQLVVPRIAISVDAGDIPIASTLINVTRPMEAAVSTVPGVVKVDTTTARGSVELDVTFSSGTDMELALQRTQSQLATLRAGLPAGTSVAAAIINPSIFPIMGYSLTSGQEPLADLRTLALYTLRPRLSRLAGVAQIRVTGGDVPEFLVSVHPEALAARGLSPQDVEDALARANAITSVGTYVETYQRYQVIVSGLLHDVTDLQAVTVATHKGVPIPVSAVATVTPTTRLPTVLASGNGHPAVVLNVIKQPAANTIQVADEVRAALEQLRGGLPARVVLTNFYDQSEIVRQSEASVVEAVAIGGGLAMLVLTLFLGNLRGAAIVLLLLPITLLTTLGLMQWLGMTLNIMTLGAIAIALGLVIDDGIVVVEDIFAHLERGLPRGQAITRGLHAILPGMLGSSLTTIGAFLPLTLLTGVTGQFFGPLAVVMSATLLASLVLSLVLTPLFAHYMLPVQAVDSGWLSWLPRQTERLGHAYAGALKACFRRRWLVLLLLMPLLGLSGWLYVHLETGFFPEFDEGAFVIDYFTPPGTSLEETDRMCLAVEHVLGDTEEVAAWSRLSGARSGSGLELTEPNQGDILVRLKPDRNRSAEDVMDDVRSEVAARVPAFQMDTAQILQDGIGDIEGAPQPIEVKIFGEDETVLQRLAHKVGERVSHVAGVVDENDGVVETGPEQMVTVDSSRASRYGLSTSDVISAASLAISGSVATTVQVGEQAVDVRVETWRSGRMVAPGSVPDVLLPVPGTPGHTVRLRQLATLETRSGAAEARRENQLPMVAVTARLEGVDLGTGVRQVQQALADLAVPPGCHIEYGGLFASQQQSFRELLGVLAVAVMLISTLLIVQFRSFRQVVALMVAALLSQSGVLLALRVTGTPLNISSFTGAIMIIGVITENGVFMFDTFNLLVSSGNFTVESALAEAGRLRLRPILMTKLGAILAMLPLALGFGAGARMQRPLAIAVVGGLSIATIFTLVVAPTLFIAMRGSSRGGD